MKRMTSMGLCLAAVVAISLVGVSSAVALPEYGICKKEAGAATHEYTNNSCTKLSVPPNKGKYRWIPGPNGAKGNFSAKTGEAKLSVPSAGTAVECTASSNKGKTLSTTETKVEKLKFTGCKSAGESCQGRPSGAVTSGQIETYTLMGKLGYIKKAAPIEVGTMLTGTGPLSGGAHKTKLLAKFFCGPVEIKASNAVIGQTTGIVNKKPAATHKELFVESGGKQVPEKFEGEVEKQTLISEFSVAGTTEFESIQTAEATVKGKLEVKA